MPLTLTIIRGATPDPGVPHSHTWNQRGGTLGRAGNNDWTLPDPEQSISRCHARVRYEQGSYFLEDTSTNGILLGDGITPMDTTTPHLLRDGEELGIGGYQIRVRIDADAILSPDPMANRGSLAAPISGGLNNESPPDPLALLGGQVEAPIDSMQPPPRHESYLNEHFDLPAFEHSVPAPTPIPTPVPSPTPSAPAANPAPGGSAPGPSSLLPDDWWTQPVESAPNAAEPPPAPIAHPLMPEDVGAPPFAPPLMPEEAAPVPPAPVPDAAMPSFAPPPTPGQTAPPAPVPVPDAAMPSFAPPPTPGQAAPPAPVPASAVPAAAPPAGSPLQGDALRELLRGAGLDPENLPPELAEDLGGILRIAVQGVMDLMRARAEIKNEFRMSVTMIQATDNNPLKFSTGVEDALNNLLVKRNPSYLSAIEAFEAGFEDLRFHQVALLSGMRDAFFEMLRQLDPATLEKRFQEQSSPGSMLGRIARPKPWDQYKALFAEIHRDTEGYFNRLFGETFVAAYERRMHELQENARRRD